MIHILCSVFAYYFATLCVIGFDVTAKAPSRDTAGKRYGFWLIAIKKLRENKYCKKSLAISECRCYNHTVRT